MVELTQFQSLSKYERKVDLKKLKFIYDAVADYIRESSDPGKLKILEIGCGDGSITMPLSAFGGSVTSFDIDDNLVAGVKKEIDKRNIPNVDVSRENAYYFSRNDKFDIIVASEVLEHLDHPEKVVSNMKAHLVSGGYCIVTVPNGYGPWEISNKIKKALSLRRGGIANADISTCNSSLWPVLSASSRKTAWSSAGSANLMPSPGSAI
jgi:2-polyprenyl-3-methyl-5-hydroxy-6-metoxy-1,4-benzoquinol methylase